MISNSPIETSRAFSAPVSHLATAVALALSLATGALAQNYPPPASVPGAVANPVCGRLEAQLAAIERGGGDPARADQARRLEDVLSKQQGDLDRSQAQYQRLGCQPLGLFSIFANQAPACGPLNGQIAQMRAAIDRTMSDLQRTRRGGDDEVQRQAVIGALAQNSCGPQYRAAAPRGFFESLFGGPQPANVPAAPPGDYPQVGGSGYKTLCVRTCDGYYFPISFSTSPSHFAEDEQVCQRQCPGAEAVLFSYRNPGEEVGQAVAGNGRAYRDLANAFRYRRELVPACGCKAPGQSWAEALGQTKDSTVERGDIVVTEERAKALAQPRDAQGRTPATARQDTRKGAATTPAVAPPVAADSTPAPAAESDPKRTVRSVGPTFIPAQ